MIDKNHEKDLFSIIGTLKETLDSQAHLLRVSIGPCGVNYGGFRCFKQEHKLGRIVV